MDLLFDSDTTLYEVCSCGATFSHNYNKKKHFKFTPAVIQKKKTTCLSLLLLKLRLMCILVFTLSQLTAQNHKAFLVTFQIDTQVLSSKMMFLFFSWL